jgi:hypothetical protein
VVDFGKGEEEKMPIYSVEMTHAAISCPVFNDEVKKTFKEGAANRGAAAQKHSVKVLVGCICTLEHVVWYVVEAPAQSAVEEYLKDGGWAFFNNVRIREVQMVEEVQQRYGLTP